MTKRRILGTALVAIILAALFYLQFRTWKSFDWERFWHVTRALTGGRGLAMLLSGVALIYCTYFLRALRWKIFLRPVAKSTVARLTPPHIVGFTGLALLGRPGELIRPYLISRRENLSFSSQIAVWTVERIFDIGAVAVMLAIDVFVAFPQFKRAGVLVLLLTAALAAGAFLVWAKTETFARLAERGLGAFSPRLAASAAEKVRAFGAGLNTIHDATSFLQLVVLSLVIWLVIATAYLQVAHAYPYPHINRMNISHLLLVMGSSMVGSVLQLPGVGGGSQLAVISVLSSPLFNLRQELAVSAGIMLWLVTFMSVIPAGLVLAHYEHVSLRKLSEEAARQEQEAASVPTA
jgi:uncharacterized protein (TIRG00374 family)